MPAVDARELVALAERAARAAGALLRDGLELARTNVSTKTTVTDMVTEMDHASEALVADVLLGARPDDALTGEEGGTRAGTSGVRWIVDPLDGTTNYLYGHAGFNVSIAAEVDERVVAGAVYDVIRDELFAAVLGAGATRNGAPIRCRDAKLPSDALVATGFGYAPARRQWQAAVLVDVLPRVRDIRRMGAAAIDLCSVACGRVDAYYERGLAEWDLAAGGLVATEAGARVGGIDGGPTRPGSVLAAAPAVFEQVSAIVTAAEHAAGPMP